MMGNFQVWRMYRVRNLNKQYSSLWTKVITKVEDCLGFRHCTSVAHYRFPFFQSISFFSFLGGGSNNRPIQVKNTVKREASSQPTVTQVEKVKRSESTSPTSRDSGEEEAWNTRCQFFFVSDFFFFFATFTLKFFSRDEL